jgi:hypothetical protein
MKEKFYKSFIISSLNCICQTQSDLFDPYCDYTQGVYDGLMCVADDLGISYERGETTCRFFDSEANNDR